MSVPDTSIGNVLTREKLHAAATVDGDTIPAPQATLAALEAASGKPVVGYTEQTFKLEDDSASTEGKFESGGVLGLPIDDLLKAEGSYTFHAKATYAQGQCTAQRELVWSVHVDTGIDPGRTDTTTTVTSPGVGTIVLVPRDRYGNNVGPGRGGDIVVTPTPGTTVTGPISDNGDGSYTVPVSWDPGLPGPGVVVGQPGRPPVVIGQPGGGEGEDEDLWWKILVAVLILIIVVLVIVLLLT